MVMHVMSSVCVLLQQPTDWDTVKHLMSDPIAFLKTLTTFDKDNVPDKVIKIVGLFNHLHECIKLHLGYRAIMFTSTEHTYVTCYLVLQYRLSNDRRSSLYISN